MTRTSTTDGIAAGHALTAPPLVRSSVLMLMNEELARARMREMRAEAEQARRAHRLVAARRWQRRAAAASRRARQAQMAVW